MLNSPQVKFYHIHKGVAGAAKVVSDIFTIYFLTSNPFCAKFILAEGFIMNWALPSRVCIYEGGFYHGRRFCWR